MFEINLVDRDLLNFKQLLAFTAIAISIWFAYTQTKDAIAEQRNSEFIRKLIDSINRIKLSKDIVLNLDEVVIIKIEDPSLQDNLVIIGDTSYNYLSTHLDEPELNDFSTKLYNQLNHFAFIERIAQTEPDLQYVELPIYTTSENAVLPNLKIFMRICRIERTLCAIIYSSDTPKPDTYL